MTAVIITPSTPYSYYMNANISKFLTYTLHPLIPLLLLKLQTKLNPLNPLTLSPQCQLINHFIYNIAIIILYCMQLYNMYAIIS